MNDKTRDLETQLRAAQSNVSSAESALAQARRHRVKWSIWSAIGGFLLFAVGGHWYPGYQLDSTAIETSNKGAAIAVGKVMSELCAERFMRVSGFELRLAGLKEATGDWSKANYIREKGNWAETADGEKADHDTADKCVALIAERMSAESEKTS